MNALTPTATSSDVAISQGVLDMYRDNARDMGAREGAYVKFSGNNGDFTIALGGDKFIDIPHGSRFVVDMPTARRGFVCWKDGRKVDEVSVLMSQGKPPAESTLPDHGPYKVGEDGKSSDGWSAFTSVALTVYSSDSAEVTPGTRLLLSVTSKSAQGSLANFTADWANQYQRHLGKHVVSEFGATSFLPKDRKIGKKFSPTFRVVGFVTQDEVDALAYAGEDDVSNYEEAAPEAGAAEQAAPAEKVVRRRF